MPARPEGQRPAQRKVEEIRQRERVRRRKTRLLTGAAAVVVVALLAMVVILVASSQTKTVSATARGMAAGAKVDGISCDANEQVAFHIHAHLAIYVNGRRRTVPRGIGIAAPQQVQNDFVMGGKCFYWLHTHDTSGVIHIESPVQRVYTLGQFFDLWGQPLSGRQVGSAYGQVTVFVNGHKQAGDPRAVKLTSHEAIQLDVGAVAPFHAYKFAPGL